MTNFSIVLIGKIEKLQNREFLDSKLLYFVAN